MTTWLTERPAHFPGQWALGCVVCNAFEKRAREHTSRHRRCSTKWSRFEVLLGSGFTSVVCSRQSVTHAWFALITRLCHSRRGRLSMQPSCFILHSRSTLHKTAVAGFLMPDAPVSKVLVSQPDVDLLRGGVPQVCDWVRVWKYVGLTSIRSSDALSAFVWSSSRDPADPNTQNENRGSGRPAANGGGPLTRARKSQRWGTGADSANDRDHGRLDPGPGQGQPLQRCLRVFACGRQGTVAGCPIQVLRGPEVRARVEHRQNRAWSVRTRALVAIDFLKRQEKKVLAFVMLVTSIRGSDARRQPERRRRRLRCEALPRHLWTVVDHLHKC